MFIVMKKQEDLVETLSTEVNQNPAGYDLNSEQYAEIKYNNLYFRIGISLVAGHIMTNYDEGDTFFEAIFMADYLRGFVASFIIAFSLVSVIHIITVRLDGQCRWEIQTLQRAFRQAALGFVGPCILTVLAVAAFFSIFGIHILETDYLREDYIVAVMMLLIYNLYYFATYAFVRYKAIYSNHFMQTDERNYKRSSIAVQDGMSITILDESEVAAIFRVNREIVVLTFGQTHFITNHALDELERTLDPDLFFRLNRKVIAHRKSCISYKDSGFGKLKITLSPVCPEDTTVSQRKAALFKDWFKSQVFT